MWRRPRDWSLRARLVAGTVLVLAMGLIVVDVFGIIWLRYNLVLRVDSQLRDIADMRGGPGDGGPPPPQSLGTPGPPAGAGRYAGPDAGPPGGQPPASPPQDPADRLNGSVTDLPTRTDVQKYLLSASGSVTAEAVATQSPNSPPRLTPDLINAVGLPPRTVPAVDGHGSWRLIVKPEGPDGYEVIAISMAETDDTVRALGTIDLLVTLAAMLVLAVFATIVIRMGLRPLIRMQATAERITADDLSARLPELGTRTETGRLVRSFNTMLNRIEAAVTAQRASEERLRRFVADASHELRTPLTSIRGFAELHRTSAEHAGRTDQVARRIEDEARRMGVLVDDLLLLAQLDARRPLNKAPVDLLEVVADAAQAAHVQDLTRPVLVEGARPGEAPEPVTVIADEYRLRQVVGNLLANALRHTPPGSPLTLRVGVPVSGGDDPVEAGDDAPPAATVGVLGGPPAAVLEVVDAGPGVSADTAVHLFERFWRADPARARGPGGAGLGLAIVAAIVNAHRGRVELYTRPGSGCRFRVLLPEA